MPLCWFRRPAFLVLLLVMAACVWRRERGEFRLEIGREEVRRVLGRRAAVEGLVVSPLREGARGETVVLEAGLLDGEPWRRRVQVHLPRAANNGALRPGMTLALRGAFRRPYAGKNPGDFDERAFLERKRIGWIFAAHELKVLPAKVPWRWRLSFAAEGVRRALTLRLRSLLPREEARLTTGLLLGSPGPLGRDFTRAVRDAGATHLLVPSGTQVAFAMLGAAWAGKILGLWVWGRFALAAALGGFYAVMTGAEPPQLRALAGGLALYAGLLCGREAGAFQALVLSAVALLLAEPRELFGAGFQMTYLASAGLMAVLPRVDAAMKERPIWLRAAAQTAAATVVVQALLWPVSANLFGRAALLGAAANLLLVPLSGLLMAAGTLLLALSAAGAGVFTTAAAALVAGLAGLFRVICLWAASWPWAAVDAAPMSGMNIAAYYLILIPLMAGVGRRAIFLALAASSCLWAGSAAAEKMMGPPLRVVYLWPAEARTALVSFDGERHWLINAGVPAKTIVKTLRQYKIGKLERLVFTGVSPAKGTALRKLLEWGYIRPNDVIPIEPGRRMEAICLKRVCAEFDPPRLNRGQAQFSIIPSSLRHAAIEAATNGDHVIIRAAAGQEIH